MQTIPQRGKFRPELLPPIRTVLERDGFRLGRPNRAGWYIVRGDPPCHRSRSGKSLYAHDSGHWWCFGCGDHGDLVAYVRLRDRCDFQGAARRLGAWAEDVTPEEAAKFAREDAQREQEREQADCAKELGRRKRLKLRDELHAMANIYREISERLSELRQGVPEVYSGEIAHCAAVLPLALDELRSAEAAYCAAAGIEDPYA